MPAPSQTGTPASFALRLVAALYDALPVLALWFVATLLALALTGGALDVQRLPHKVLLQALLLTVTGAYFVISWCRGGQTIPNSLLNMTRIKPRTEHRDANNNQLPHLRRMQVVAQ